MAECKSTRAEDEGAAAKNDSNLLRVLLMTPVGSAVFFAVSMLVVVASVVWWALRVERRAKSEPMWPTVTGLVTSSAVISGKTLKPKIVYIYSFNGTEHVGKVIQSNLVLYSGAKSAERLCARFPVGSRPAVYVDDSRPQRAVLVPGGDRAFLYFVLALATFFLLTSVVVVMMMMLSRPS